jgi:hypothetical protein
MFVLSIITCRPSTGGTRPSHPATSHHSSKLRACNLDALDDLLFHPHRLLRSSFSTAVAVVRQQLLQTTAPKGDRFALALAPVSAMARRRDGARLYNAKHCANCDAPSAESE